MHWRRQVHRQDHQDMIATPPIWTPRREIISPRCERCGRLRSPRRVLPRWRRPQALFNASTGKYQRDSATGKRYRDPATGKRVRGVAGDDTCCCEAGSVACAACPTTTPAQLYAEFILGGGLSYAGCWDIEDDPSDPQKSVSIAGTFSGNCCLTQDEVDPCLYEGTIAGPAVTGYSDNACGSALCTENPILTVLVDLDPPGAPTMMVLASWQVPPGSCLLGPNQVNQVIGFDFLSTTTGIQPCTEAKTYISLADASDAYPLNSDLLYYAAENELTLTPDGCP